LGVSCSGSVFSAPVVSVSMSVVLRGAKKFRVEYCFWRQLDNCGYRDWFIWFLGSLWGIIRDMLLGSLYFPEVIILDRLFHWGFVHCVTLSCLCTHLYNGLQFI
jgi:hypothetical protein